MTTLEIPRGEKVEFTHVKNVLVESRQEILKITEWRLVGLGVQSTEECGSVVGLKACEAHKGGYKLLYHRCFKPECPICYEAWARREAERAAERLKGISKLYGDVGGCKHIILSPPQAYALDLIKTSGGYKQLRHELVKLLKKSGFHGCIVPHPFRKNKVTGLWYLSPHFHVVGYGYLPPSDEFYDQSGWVYKNKGHRKSIFGTIFYELSHSGLAYERGERVFHSLTWYGKFSYNKAIIESEEKVLVYEKCKICGSELHKYVPKQYGTDYYDKDHNWIYSNFDSWFDDGPYVLKKIRRTYRIKGDVLK